MTNFLNSASCRFIMHTAMQSMHKIKKHYSTITFKSISLSVAVETLLYSTTLNGCSGKRNKTLEAGTNKTECHY